VRRDAGRVFYRRNVSAAVTPVNSQLQLEHAGPNTGILAVKDLHPASRPRPIPLADHDGANAASPVTYHREGGRYMISAPSRDKGLCLASNRSVSPHPLAASVNGNTGLLPNVRSGSQ